MKTLTTAALILAAAGLGMASDGDDLTSLSYISYLERYATVQPADQQEAIEAQINMPLVAGDRIDTAREARMEVFLADGNTVWLDQYTTLSLDAVAFSRASSGDRTVLYVGEGTIMVEVSQNALGQEPIRVDGGAATVYLDSVGLYRIEALPEGRLRLEVWEGLAEASTTAGGVLVRAKSTAEVGAGQVGAIEPDVGWGDDFAAWVEQRRAVNRGDSGQHIEARYERQAAQLDNYGTWVYVGSINSWAWQPTAVGPDWRPYGAGRWYWTPVGWSWLSYEPWGWLPYHYGSWYFDVGFGWVWSWYPYWSPAWVRWVWWPGYVGWCPWGYYDPWRPYYYGSYPPYHGHGPGHGGGGGYGQPPRRDVIPPPRAADTRVGHSALTPPGGDVSADLNGRVRVAEMDRRGWTVVSEGDFSSPHLTRLAKPLERMEVQGNAETGIVMSRPLATASPDRVRTGAELERVFRSVGEASPEDLGPVLGRDNHPTEAEAMRLAPPVSLADVSRRATVTREAMAPSVGPTSPMRSPAVTAPTAGRRVPIPPATISTREPQATSRNPFVSRQPVSRVTPYGEPGSGSAISPRGPVPYTGPSTGSARPVIVPRTSTSRPPSYGTSSAPSTRSPSTVRQAPSSTGGSSARPSAPSSRSAPPSAHAPSGGGHSSGGSRSGGAAQSRPSGQRKSN